MDIDALLTDAADQSVLAAQAYFSALAMKAAETLPSWSLVDEPIDVPDGLSREEVSDFTVGLQQVMDSVYDRVEGMKKAA